ncbi:hypothetical protein DH2020_037992 [Rehmannia glutinosa]|uniref:RNase H type-1 domain-containing protein n=1 Tax=Rehmannia glutinosa TaxID=99300 RepID=A0ABR0V1S7_REHGL
MWAIWNNRNEVVWNSKSNSAAMVVNYASSFLIQWESAQQVEIGDWRIKSRDGAAVWNKPKQGELKCNVDGAIFSHEDRVGYGCVVRNFKGEFVAAKKGVLQGINDPEIVEAISFREALSWIKNRFKDVVMSVETDSLCVIQAIWGKAFSNSYFSTVIGDCINMLRELPLVSCVFVRRSVNRVAHGLAKAMDSMSGVVVWENTPLSFICNLLLSDINE